MVRFLFPLVFFDVFLIPLSPWRRFSLFTPEVVEEMHRDTVSPDIITYNALLGACTRRADWQSAMAWLNELKDVA